MNILKENFLKRNLNKINALNALKNLKNRSYLSMTVFRTFSSNMTSTSNIRIKSFEKRNNFYSSNKAHFSQNLPRHIVLQMPNLSPTMTQGNIVQWNKKEGDSIKQGESLASIETDKAQVDFEVNEDGYVAKLLFPAGAKDVQLGTPVAIIVEEKSHIEAFANYKPEEASSKETPKKETTQKEAPKMESAPKKIVETQTYPRHIKLAMPNLSPTMTTGNIVQWTKKEGDFVKPGDVLANIETDKAQVDFEMNEEGYVAKLLFPSGAKDINVGSLIAILVEEKKDLEAFKNFKEGVATSQPAQEKEAQRDVNIPNQRIVASPLAKKTARENDIALEGINGTGPRGRIISDDVLQAKEKSKSVKTEKVEKVQSPQEKEMVKEPTTTAINPDFEDIQISNIRKVTAERLAFSKSSIPHFYISLDCNVDKVNTLRAELNKHSPVKLSFNDIIIKAASLACMKVPETNSSWQGTFIRKFKNVDMSVAVQTDYGLITPIVTNSNLKGLAQISREVKDLAERAKQRKLKPQEFMGGTFTISNMGMMGITNFSAVINPPQACILAVGKSEKKILYDENAKDKTLPYKVSTMMSCTLSCDHRVVDGAFGAMWVQEFKNLIENPELMLL